MSRVAVVTGAARGIGLASCRQLLGRDWRVIACPRVPDGDSLASLVAEHETASEVSIDVGDDTSVAEGAAAIAREVDHVDLLVNNAGVYPDKGGGLEGLDPEQLIRAFNVNAVGALRVTRAMLPLLRRGSTKKIANITSLMGSIEDNGSGGSYAYRMSKTALNMAGKNLGHELGPEGFVTLTIHPGWVQTRMGGGGAPLALADAVSQILETVLEATPADNGTFKRFDGRDLPW